MDLTQMSNVIPVASFVSDEKLRTKMGPVDGKVGAHREVIGWSLSAISGAGLILK